MCKLHDDQCDDERLAKEFVEEMLAYGKTTSGYIADFFHKGGYSFPLINGASHEVFLATLSTALAVLKGHTQLMTSDRGTRIGLLCRQSIEQNYGLRPESVSLLIDGMHEYQAGYDAAVQRHSNPFVEISGIMLVRQLGSDVISICLEDTCDINPFLLEAVSDIMTLTVTNALRFWKTNISP